MSIEILEFTRADYDAAFELWQRSAGVGISEADTRPNIERYLERNPGMSFVARAKTGLPGSGLVGSILAGHDGRRGYIHHLAVDVSVRRQGVGSRLVDAALAALKNAGIQKCHLFLFNNNVSGLSFWQSQGWERRGDICIVSKEIAFDETKCPC
jgi:ribosomal protein S18 acetylase RimI-like enzyme